MIICISGTPGTGKSSAGRCLAQITGFKLIETNTFAQRHNLIMGQDKRRKSLIVDTNGLKKASLGLKGDIILAGHIAHFAKCDICIVLRANPRVLEARLKKRRWAKEKIAENIGAEILDACLKEAVEECGKGRVFEIDTTGKTAKAVACEAKKIIDGKENEKYLPGKIDWTKYLRF